nr:amino acid ABC transporter permease [Georgenia sp. EYE_87]
MTTGTATAERTGQSAPDLIRAHPVRRPGRVVSAVVVAVLAAMVVNTLVTNPNFRWDVVWLYLRDVNVVRGVGWTLLLTAGSMVVAVALAMTLAIMRRSDNPVMRWVSWIYIWFFRGTPVYTQLVFWGLLGVLYPRLSLGIPFGPEFVVLDTNAVFSAAWAALIGLALNEAAYLSEIFRSGLGGVDPGQAEAARALGMNESAILRRVVLPQAMRVIVPPTGNETISMLKTTSLVLAVPFTLDLTFATNAIGNRIFLPIPLLMVAAIWYLVITSVLMVGQHYLELYYGRGFDGAAASGRGPAGGRRALGRRQQAVLAAGTTNDDPFLEYTP